LRDKKAPTFIAIGLVKPKFLTLDNSETSFIQTLLGYGHPQSLHLRCQNYEYRDAQKSLSLVDMTNPPLPQNQIYRLLVQAVQDYAIFALDPKGHIQTWNEGAKRLKGYTADEVIGSHFSLFYSKEDRTRNHPDWELQQATKYGTYEEEGWRLRKDGSRFWVSVTITALRDEQGHLQGFGKVTRDLTQKRLAEEELRQSEERFRLMIEGVKDYAIFALDPQGFVATWNDGAERNKGYTAYEIIGEHFSKFYPEEDKRQTRVRTARSCPSRPLRRHRLASAKRRHDFLGQRHHHRDER
jgi:PAS domain S-box-containing protein